MKSVSELLNQVLETTTDNMYCNLPCKVEKVNGNYVDVKVYINDEEPDLILYNVPIQRQETQRAYIFLGIKENDRGTLKFFDRSTEGYLQSDFDYNSDDRQHDINDRCFELGFIPDKEAYQYLTEAEIEIGLKNQTFKLSVDTLGNLVINATSVSVSGNLSVTGAITATGEITANVLTDTPIMLSKHIHTDTSEPTGNVP